MNLTEREEKRFFSSFSAARTMRRAQSEIAGKTKKNDSDEKFIKKSKKEF
jgi:hypothetical protein